MIKKKIMIISDYWPAKNYGGPVVSISNIVESCSNTFEFFILAKNHDLNSNLPLTGINDGINKVGKANVLYLTDKKITYQNLNKITKDIKPDLIYQNSIFYAIYCIPMLRIAKKYRIPFILSTRGELCTNAFNLNKSKKSIYLKLLKISGLLKDIYYHSTSHEENEQIQKLLSVKAENIFEIKNIPSMLKMDNVSLNKNKVKNKLKVVFLSRIQVKKNLKYAIQIIKQLKCDVIFDIYGPVENEEYWIECNKLLKDIPPNILINYKGILERECLFSTLNQYDVMFFPTLSENYGHVIIEAMLSLCPVIISDQTPWNDLNTYEAGWALPLDNESAFVNALELIADMDKEKYEVLVNNCNDYVRNQLDIQGTIDAYIKNFNKIIMN